MDFNEIKDKVKTKLDEEDKKRAERNKPEAKFERYENTEANKRARDGYSKLFAKYSDMELTEEQEAILFSQAYHQPFLKNPAGAKFPEFEEYIVKKNGDVYVIDGYVDATNSYGAPIREKYKLEMIKKDGKWTVIKDGSGAYLVYLIVFGLLILVPLIIAYVNIKKIQGM